MAYARYERGCNWYIFWESSREDQRGAQVPTSSKEKERLVVWHGDHRNTPALTYFEVCQMVAADDFTAIPGFQPIDKDLLRTCLSAFVKDVDKKFSSAA